jgi:hypothetical protein
VEILEPLQRFDLMLERVCKRQPVDFCVADQQPEKSGWAAGTCRKRERRRKEHSAFMPIFYSFEAVLTGFTLLEFARI